MSKKDEPLQIISGWLAAEYNRAHKAALAAMAGGASLDYVVMYCRQEYRRAQLEDRERRSERAHRLPDSGHRYRGKKWEKY